MSAKDFIQANKILTVYVVLDLIISHIISLLLAKSF